MTSTYQTARSIPTANSFPIERPAAPHNSHQAAKKLIENIKQFSKLKIESMFQGHPEFPSNSIKTYLRVIPIYDGNNEISIRIDNFFPACSSDPWSETQKELFSEIFNYIQETLQDEMVFKHLKIDDNRDCIYIYRIQPAEETIVQEPVNPHIQRPRCVIT